MGDGTADEALKLVGRKVLLPFDLGSRFSHAFKTRKAFLGARLLPFSSIGHQRPSNLAILFDLCFRSLLVVRPVFTGLMNRIFLYSISPNGIQSPFVGICLIPFPTPRSSRNIFLRCQIK